MNTGYDAFIQTWTANITFRVDSNPSLNQPANYALYCFSFLFLRKRYLPNPSVVNIGADIHIGHLYANFVGSDGGPETRDFALTITTASVDRFVRNATLAF